MQLQLGDVAVEVVLKDIKNLHLSVHPPAGRVQISAPAHLSSETIRAFAISKLDWIRRKQKILQEQERKTPREYLERESHYLWGRRFLLTVCEHNAPPSIDLENGRMILSVRPGTDEERRQAAVEAWYRDQVKSAVPPLIARWEPLMGVKVEHFYVRRMKTRWGSCNRTARTIRLNTELVKKPLECLEYVIVHELAHLLERTHNDRFVALMDHFMPQWKFHRDVLNRLPVRRETWSY